MTENELKRCREAFEVHYDQWRKDNPTGIYHSFQAWQHQQTTIDALMQNIESMSQTNAALIKRLEQAVEALEFYADDKNRGLKLMGKFNGGDVYCDEYVHDNGKKAQTALNQIKGNI